jgi:hypothetical protein
VVNRVAALNLAEAYSYENVRQVLKKQPQPWRKKRWCIPAVSPEIVAAMEDVLEFMHGPIILDVPGQLR